MKNTKSIITIIVLLLVGVGAYYLFSDSSEFVASDDSDQEMATDTPATSTDESATTTETDEEATTASNQTVIGTSVDGRDITAYQFGDGETELLFVGGIHGGYEFNTTLLSYDIIDYLQSNPSVVPSNVSVTVIPVLNPDGLYRIAGTTGDDFTAADMPSLSETIPGRFNANNVDLNRNFDCNWQSQSSWQTRTVSGGEDPFSEPESQAIRDYVRANNPDAAVVFYSAAGGVYSSSCDGPVSTQSIELMNLYASASGYAAEGEFTAYPINGDMVNWMAGEDIPAISVLLTNHQDVEWSRNQAGLEAVLDFYAN
ncbi:MAG: M14 family metallopeptidase [Candidatus Paceibacterota bacterium]